MAGEKVITLHPVVTSPRRKSNPSKHQSKMNSNTPPESAFENRAALLDKTGEVLLHVLARFSPSTRSGTFRLPPSANVDLILKSAAKIRTIDNRAFELAAIKQCPAFHVVRPDQPHIEFDYQPQ
jgi:hypothetical protein